MRATLHFIVTMLGAFFGAIALCFCTVVCALAMLGKRIDPTHKRGYMTANFEFLDPDMEWGRKAVVYSPYGWKLLSCVDDGGNINATLEVRKS